MKSDKHIGIISACAHRLYLYRPELFGQLWEEGYKVTVFGPEEQSLGDEWLNKEGIDYVCLGIGRRTTVPSEELKARDILAKTAKERGIGLFFSYGIRNAPLVNLASKKAGIPCINVINGAGSLFIVNGFKGRLKRAVITPYIKFALRNSSKVVFQNDDDRNLFVSGGLVKPEKCFMVAGSGVNTARFPVFPLPEEKVFGFCSRMNPEKGVDEMLTAFSEVIRLYPDARLRLAGEMDGIENTPAEEKLNSLIKGGFAEYLGEISDVPGFLSQCRFFVFPSYREGTPRATLEAMSCGRPIITTDVTGCRETVKNGFNGILVIVKDSETLKEAMLDFCSGKADVTEMGRNSRKTVEEKFDVYAVNSALIGEIKKLY